MTQPKPERLRHDPVQERFDRSPFISTLGLKVVALDYDASELTVEMALRPSFERRAGTRQFHGGPIAAFIDTVGDFASVTPAVGDALGAVARVRRAGRTVTVVDIDVFNPKDEPVAIGRGTYASVAG